MIHNINRQKGDVMTSGVKPDSVQIEYEDMVTVVHEEQDRKRVAAHAQGCKGMRYVRSRKQSSTPPCI